MGRGFRSFFYTASDGLRLHARIHGEEHGGRLPVICLPGLTRNARDFDALAAILANDSKRPRRVIAFDYRGRGLSDRDPDWRNYAVPRETADVLDGLTVLGIEHAAFVGTSRGGLIIMAIAAARPALLKAAVLNDIGPVVEGDGLAHIRSYLTNAPRPAGIEEAIALQKAILGQSYSALAEADWERHARAYYRIEANSLVPDFDPRLVRTLTAIDLNRPLPTAWPQFLGLSGIPLLAVRGANSLFVSKQTFSEMAAQHPDLEAVTVAGQGHAPLLETGDLPRQIAHFLARAERSTVSAG